MIPVSIRSVSVPGVITSSSISRVLGCVEAVVRYHTIFAVDVLWMMVRIPLRSTTSVLECVLVILVSGLAMSS